MMRIKMLESRIGTQDGFKVEQFVKGEKYEVRDHLARAFFAAGDALPIAEERR